MNTLDDKHHQALNRLDADERATCRVDTPRGSYERLGLPTVPELPEGAADDVPDAPPVFDREAAIAALRAFLQAEAATGFTERAEAGKAATWASRGVHVIRRPDGDLLLTRATWSRVLASYGEREAARELARAGWLAREPDGRHARAERIGGQVVRVYRIRAGFLADA